MKKIIVLLLFLISLTARTAMASVYSINVGSETELISDGYLWNPYNGPEYTQTDYGSFIYTMGTVEAPFDFDKQDLFAGYATGNGDTYFGFQIYGVINNTPLEITAYSDSAIPVLQSIDGAGEIGTLKSSGTTTLGGVSYYFSKYNAITTDEYIYAYYNSDLNAIQVTVPEPATMILIGVGGMMAAAMRKRRTVIAA